MHDFQELLVLHGGMAVVQAVFAEQLGTPLFQTPLLVLAGTWVALVHESFLVMIANVMWLYVGRRIDVQALGWQCKGTMSPDSCLCRNEMRFARRGVWALLLAKFVPGLSTLASPLAGVIGTPPRQFFAYNLAGTALWAASGLSIDWLVGEELDDLLAVASEHAMRVGLWSLAVIFAYLTWRGVRRWRRRHAGDGIERIRAESLHLQLSEGGRHRHV